jgi:hypothetical protein
VVGLGGGWCGWLIWGSGRVFLWFFIFVNFNHAIASWDAASSLPDVRDGVLIVGGDCNCLMFEDKVCIILSGWIDVASEELHVKCFMVDKGCEVVEVVACSVEPNDNCSVDYPKGDDD